MAEGSVAVNEVACWLAVGMTTEAQAGLERVPRLLLPRARRPLVVRLAQVLGPPVSVGLGVWPEESWQSVVAS